MHVTEEKRELTAYQRVLLSMLWDLDAVCRANDIKYMLFAGTALGAVRHGGFIPWDDDIDVIMLRGEYEKFLDAAEKELDSKNILFNANLASIGLCSFQS